MIDNNHVGPCSTDSITAILFDIIGSAAESSVAEAVPSPPSPHAHVTAVRVDHFHGLANPAGHTTVGTVQSCAADPTAVPPATITDKALTHNDCELETMALKYIKLIIY